MKKLKKLSLKEEVDKEAQEIEKEVESRDDLDDINVSEDMETSLFNKIQEYEYDKPRQEETPSLSGACSCVYSCVRERDNWYRK